MFTSSCRESVKLFLGRSSVSYHAIW
jgi:hypothetical protein